MSAPRRWLEDPEADEALREVLRTTPRARPLDAVTRRRLRGRVARASALPAAAAGWLFVKSAGAALGVVLGAGAIAVATGVVDWSASPAPSNVRATPPAVFPTPAAPVQAPAADQAPEVPREAPPSKAKLAPSLPTASASGSASSAGTLSAEAALLEQARRQMRTAPAVALTIAAEHAQRFARGQLSSERKLIQIEALHRLGRDTEARALARSWPAFAGSGLYAERLQQLLGDNVEP